MRLFHSLTTVALLAVLATAHSQAASAEDAGQQYRFARGLYARQQWEAAAREFQDFLDRQPEPTEAALAHFYLGEALVQLGQYSDAAPHFESYLQTEANGSLRRLALFRIGECSYLGKRPPATVQQLAAFSETYPDDPLNSVVLRYRGSIALEQGEPATAEAIFRRSLERSPNAGSKDDCRIGLARALEALGRTEEAERYYAAVAAKPSSPRAVEARYRLGALHYALGQYEAARMSFERLNGIADTSPWAVSARLGRGWALVHLDRHEEAQAIFRELIDHPDAAIQARYWLGLCRKAAQQWNDATTEFLNAAERLKQERTEPTGRTSAGDVTETAIFFHAGDSQLAAGKPGMAREYLNRALAYAGPDDTWLGPAQRAVVQASIRYDDSERARRDAERFLAEGDSGSVAADLLRLLARALLEDEEFVDAERTLCRLDEATLDSGTRNDDALLLGLAYQGQRRFEDALRVLAPLAARAEPDLEPEVRMAQGSALVALKRFDEALTVLASCRQSPNAEIRSRASALAAVSLAHLGRLAEAQQVCDQALRGDEGSLDQRWNTIEQIAQAALDAKDYERAEPLLRELIASDATKERKARALVSLAWVQHARSNHAAAETSLAMLPSGLQEVDLTTEALFLRGCVQNALGREREALDAFERLVTEHRDSEYYANALWEAAKLRERLGSPAEAAGFYRAIVELPSPHPKQDGALYSLAWIRHAQGAVEEAMRFYQTIVDDRVESPYWPHAALSLAQARLDREECTEAEAVIQRLLAREKTDPLRDQALYLAGQIAFAAGKWQLAEQRFDLLAAECPQSELAPTAAYGAAEAAFRGERISATERFERLVNGTTRLPPGLRATARMRLAQLHAEAGHWADALLVAKSFADEHPRFEQQYEIDYILGRCYAARGLFEEARQAYERVIHSPAGERTETAAKAQLMTAETYFHQKRYAEAYRAYMQVEILYDYSDLQSIALLQAAKCRQLQGAADAAAVLYRQVMKNYPGTRAAAEAASRLDRET